MCVCVIHGVIFVGCSSPKPLSIVPQRWSCVCVCNTWCYICRLFKPHVVLFVGCLSPKASSIVPQRLRYEDWSTQDVSEWLSSNSINNIPVKM